MLWGLLALFAVVVVVVAGTFYWAEQQISPGGHPGASVKVTIPKGASTAQIGHLLASAGVIHSPTVFQYYVKIEGDGPFYPGSYQLRKNSSYRSVISVIDQPPAIVTDRLTIPEGYTMAQIAKAVAALPNMHLSADKFLQAASSGEVRSPYEPAGINSLEGLVFPATYQVHQGETEVDVLETMVAAFDEQAGAIGLTPTTTVSGLSAYQVVTVASIVEREVKLAGDRAPTASVIYNRLKIGMPLGADSTQTYYLRLTDPTLVPTVAQLDTAGPYNTRQNKGLPPTPIANPGLPSLQAALNPASTTYLYFVEVQPNGQLGFASTADGFAQLQAQCRAAKLC